MTNNYASRRSVKHGIPSISGLDAKRQLQGVLTDQWQTLGVITAQIVIAPELVCRKQIVSQSREPATARQNIVTTSLKHMVAKGSVERKKNKEGRWMYRMKVEK